MLSFSLLLVQLVNITMIVGPCLKQRHASERTGKSFFLVYVWSGLQRALDIVFLRCSPRRPHAGHAQDVSWDLEKVIMVVEISDMVSSSFLPYIKLNQQFAPPLNPPQHLRQSPLHQDDGGDYFYN